MTIIKSLASLIVASLTLFAGSALAQDVTNQALVAEGKYLAIAGDCAACHTTETGKPFAGGLALTSPIGEIFSTNITPSKQFGIGAYSLEDFERAVRHGVRKDGANLYPAMPYTAYSSVSDDDVKALYAYFMHGVAPVDAAGSRTSLPFPFNIRLSMMGWNLVFAQNTPFKADPSKSAEWNRGAYLAEGLAHCSTCHTPRNFLMAEEGGKALSGASLGTWFAPNITSDAMAGIGKWSVDDIVAYLSTGRSSTGSQAGGPMLEAIDKSFSKLDARDVEAIATYIHGVGAQSMNAAPGNAAKTLPVLTDFALMTGTASEGATLYSDHCATCHQASGEGRNGLPALFGNAALVHRPTADNVAMAVMDGLVPHAGQAMPAFKTVLNDGEIAQLSNYVLDTFGDAGLHITPERVSELRAGGTPSSLLNVARLGVFVGGSVLLLLVVFMIVLANRRRLAERPVGGE